MSYAWQDQFKALIIRYETRVDTWLNLLILSFMVIFIRRINKKINPKQLPSKKISEKRIGTFFEPF